jgi:hypothetical protein
MSNQATKLRKQKKREYDNKRKKLFEMKKRLDHKRRQTYRHNYPEFRFDTITGDPGFVKAVKKAVAAIDFDDRNVFHEWEAALYRTLKRQGTSAVRDFMRSVKQECYENGSEVGRLAELHFSFNLGQRVFDNIPEAEREIHFPTNDVIFTASGHHIQVVFRSLLKAKGAGGTIYYSRLKPTVNIGGEAKVVGFSIHALKQIGDRLKPRWRTSYAALGDVYAFFEQCIYFEPAWLYGGQVAFTFFDECHEGFVQYWYVQDVLGVEHLNPRAGRPHYRVGYCPAVVEGEFIKAKTLLLPGFTATPEYSAIIQSRLPRPERQKMILKARQHNAMTLYESQDLSLIKWFHDHGVPQVKLLNHSAYAYIS